MYVMSRNRNKNITNSASILNTIKQKPIVKNEFDGPGDQIFHRKSERRRVARDIFLVFEEEPKCRAKSKGSCKNLSRMKAKSKFGHLKVEEYKNAYSQNKNLMLNVKTDTKSLIVKTSSNKKRKSFHEKRNQTSIVPAAKVNPIFLWVKQDDTRIVEVRCEDYDKRNRIRITKTKNGWRAVPRTDSSSSRIVKYLPTPLLKVKRENLLLENKHIVNDGRLNNIKDKKNTFVQSNEIIQSLSNSNKKENVVNFSCGDDGIIYNKLEVYESALNADVTFDSAIDKSSESVETNFKNSVHNETKVILPNSEEIVVSNIIAKTYQSYTSDLELCPETGLFIPRLASIADEDIDQMKTIIIEDTCTENNKSQSEKICVDLDDETQNLKDLLDDADLLQHCTDNVNNCVELIDSLVKHSCEKNLITDTGEGKEEICINTFSIEENVLMQKEPISDILSRISNSINDSPKCLSFNEAGEIEDVNGEIFQSNNYLDHFSKQRVVGIEATPSALPSNDVISNMDLALSTERLEDKSNDSPKDLSYKKRDEICPPSESRHQCDVTSTSDVLKSPALSKTPVIEPSSEIIKNIIFEQFLKLTPFNSATHQIEPINLGKTKESISDNLASTNYVETVVVDDEPTKKRVRSSNNKADSHLSNNDIDPDPLTQLKLLIRNAQWKVPDPILVPKDRLGAVLASPAREIPLLLTTRPELKLPEAFAYPEILQNPNILVISMAQLEAILRNEMELQQHKLKKTQIEFIASTPVAVDHPINLDNEKDDSNLLKSEKSKSKFIQLESDINTATLSVMNQMLWLPYVGQLSPDFLKTIKNLSIDKNNSANNSLLSFYNEQFALNENGRTNKNVATYDKINEDDKNEPLSFSNTFETFATPFELAILEKLAQAQIHRLLSLNQRKYLKESVGVDPCLNIQQKNSIAPNRIEDFTSETESFMENQSLPPFLSNNIYCQTSVHGKTNDTNEKIDNDKTQRQHVDSKPRLTCKSLSNLLDPENITNSLKPYIGTPCLASASPLQRAATSNINYSLENSELVKHRKRNLNKSKAATVDNHIKALDGLSSDPNPTLWHPLFGSNNKPGYSSPWQWTTVTASGE